MNRKVLIIFFTIYLITNNEVRSQIVSSQSGLWNDTLTWVGNMIPGSTDDVIISNGDTVSLTDDRSCMSLDINTTGTLIIQGNLSNSDSLTNDGTLEWILGEFTTNATITNNGTTIVNDAGNHNFNGNFVNNGTINWTGNTLGNTGTVLINESTGILNCIPSNQNACICYSTIQNQGEINIGDNTGLTSFSDLEMTNGIISGSGSPTYPYNLEITGLFTWSGGEISQTLMSCNVLDYSGNCIESNSNVHSNVLNFTDGAELTLKNGGYFNGGEGNIESGSVLNGTGGGAFFFNNLIKTGTGTFQINVDVVYQDGYIDIQEGTLDLNKSLTFDDDDPAYIKGNGTLDLSNADYYHLSNYPSYFSPGSSPGTLTILGKFNESLEIEIEEVNNVISHDLLIVTDTAILTDKTLNIYNWIGTIPSGSWVILTASSISGTFNLGNVPDCFSVEYTNTTITLKKIGKLKTWDGTTGVWSDPIAWIPDGVPCPLDTVVIPSGSVSLDIQPQMAILTLSGGQILNDVIDADINAPFYVSAGAIVNIAATTILDINGTFCNDGTIEGYGTIDIINASISPTCFGKWAPGNSTGVLDAKGTYNNEVIEMEIGGNGGGMGAVELDKLNVSQTMDVGGTLDLLWLGGTIPIGNRVLMECAGGSGCRTGTFAAINFPLQCNGKCNIIYTPTEVRLENTEPIEVKGSCTWEGGIGNWSNPSNWSCDDVPNFNDTVIINSGTITVDMSTSVKSMTLGVNSIITGNQLLTVTDAFTWSGGQINIDNDVNVGTAAISGPVTLANGNLMLSQGGVLNNATLIIKDEATLTVPSNKTLDFNYSSNIAINTIGPATIINNGTINKLGNGNLELFPGFQNNGELKINAGALNFKNSLTNNNLIKGVGMMGLSNANIIKMGKVAPGNSPGTLNITGNYPNQKLIIEITQDNGVQIDKLIATGELQLKDTLIIDHLGGSIPNGSYEFMTCPIGTNCRKNTFEVISYPAFCGGGCIIEYNESSVKLMYEQGLPVELAYFTGRLIDKEVQLDWTTFSEENAASFDIMRSANGSEWVYLGEVAANGTTSASHDYSFIDTDPLAGENYYRLKQHDLDGTIYYSKVIRVQTPIKKAWKLYPNPVQDILEVRFSNNEDGILQIFDATGRLVLKHEIQAEKSISVDLSNLNSGLYWVQMTGFKTAMVVKY